MRSTILTFILVLGFCFNAFAASNKRISSGKYRHLDSQVRNHFVQIDTMNNGIVVQYEVKNKYEDLPKLDYYKCDFTKGSCSLEDSTHSEKNKQDKITINSSYSFTLHSDKLTGEKDISFLRFD